MSTPETAANVPATQGDSAPDAPTLGSEIGLYLSQIDGIQATLLFGMQMAQTAQKMIAAEYEGALKKFGSVVSQNEESATYRVPTRHTAHIDGIKRSLEAMKVGVDVLPKSQLVALVSAYDHFVGRLARWYFRQAPKALAASEKKIGLAEVLEFASLDEAKEYFLEKEIDALLRQSHADQIEWFEKRLNRTLRKNLAIWSNFVELTERRNLFAHTDGLVSRQYLTVCKEHGCALDEGAKLGQRLWAPQEYFISSAATLYELGAKLGHTVWRIVAPDELVNADKHLMDLTYELLVREKYSLARALLDFAVGQVRHSSEDARLRFVVNQAQCYKWQGDEEGCRQILGAQDWSAAGPPFRICAAVLEDRFEDAAKVMHEIGKSVIWKDDYYIGWPVFKRFRESPIFIDTYRSIFGEEPTETVSTGDKPASTEDTSEQNNAVH